MGIVTNADGWRFYRLLEHDCQETNLFAFHPLDQLLGIGRARRRGMTTIFDIGFAKLNINLATKQGVAVFCGFDQKPLPVTKFERSDLDDIQ